MFAGKVRKNDAIQSNRGYSMVGPAAQYRKESSHAAANSVYFAAAHIDIRKTENELGIGCGRLSAAQKQRKRSFGFRDPPGTKSGMNLVSHKARIRRVSPHGRAPEIRVVVMAVGNAGKPTVKICASPAIQDAQDRSQSCGNSRPDKQKGNSPRMAAERDSRLDSPADSGRLRVRWGDCPRKRVTCSLRAARKSRGFPNRLHCCPNSEARSPTLGERRSPRNLRAMPPPSRRNDRQYAFRARACRAGAIGRNRSHVDG
ncbi:MAG: hypothetical protein ACREHF_04965 [Rhizomicrobium sp.]